MTSRPSRSLDRLAPVALATILLVLFGVPAYAVLARFVLHGPVNDASLQRSVALARGSDPSFPTHCTRTGTRRWRCTTPDDQSSGAVQYDVRGVDGGSCWRATLVSDSSEGAPEHVGGCVHSWQWTLL